MRRADTCIQSLKFRILALILSSFVPSLMVSASAQPSGAPRRGEPSRYERYSNPQSEPSAVRSPVVRLQQPVEHSQAPAISPFTLSHVEIQGATAISADQISATYSENIGSVVSGEDVLAISQKITALYRSRGYHLSRAIIPAQDLQGGALRVQVIEGSIEEVSLAEKQDPLRLLPILRPITAERPSTLATVERQLLLVNDRPGARVSDVTLEEIGTATGKFRLVVAIEMWRVFWTQGLDNGGAKSVGPLQGYTSAAFNSLLVSGDSLAVAGSMVPDKPEELRFGKVAYDLPIGIDGARLGFNAYQSSVRPGDERRFYYDLTRTTGYELRGSIVPILSRESSLTLTASASYVGAYEADLGGLYYSDQLRIGSLGADYKLKDDFNAWNNLNITLRQGFGFWGASTANDPTSRYGASGEFTAVNLAYSRLQTLTDTWSTKLAVSAQFAGNPLLLSQRYFLGGAAFGPGYYSGDNGVGGSFELRYDQKTSLEFLKGYQLYGFVDGGQVWDVHDGVRASLASMGAGARFFISEALTGGLSVAFPIHDRFGSPDVSDFRILFSVLNYFKACAAPGTWDCQRSRS